MTDNKDPKETLARYRSFVTSEVISREEAVAVPLVRRGSGAWRPWTYPRDGKSTVHSLILADYAELNVSLADLELSLYGQTTTRLARLFGGEDVAFGGAFVERVWWQRLTQPMPISVGLHRAWAENLEASGVNTVADLRNQTVEEYLASIYHNRIPGVRDSAERVLQYAEMHLANREWPSAVGIDPVFTLLHRNRTDAQEALLADLVGANIALERLDKPWAPSPLVLPGALTWKMLE